MAAEPSIIPGQWTLVFSTATVTFPTSSFVQAWTPKFRRLTAVQERQNFWCNDVIIDGRFPAQVWEHEFNIFTEAVSVTEYAQRYTDLQSLFLSDPTTLVIQENAADKIVLGGCYMRPPGLEEPKELLQFRAGFLKIMFLGNKAPEYL
jgi:hypothetical protein